MTDKNELVEVVQQSGLQQSKIDSLMQSFAGYFTEAKTIAEQAKAITVSDETQISEMQKAREFRLKLKNIRVEAEKTKVELKEQSLREGNAIQGVFNIIKALIVPVEEYLEKQEKFAEVKEAERKALRLSERVEKLSKYVSDVSLYSLAEMADEVFENLLAGCKINYEKAKAEQESAEKARLTKIEEDRKEQERIRLENEKLRKEAEEKEKELAIERAKQQEKLEIERKKRLVIEAKLKVEREETERKEREERSRLEAEKRAKEEEATKKLLAPDKAKLSELAILIDCIQFPAVSSMQAKKTLEEVEKKLQITSDFIKEEAKKL